LPNNRREELKEKHERKRRDTKFYFDDHGSTTRALFTEERILMEKFDSISYDKDCLI
jgi:hypothetical protein